LKDRFEVVASVSEKIYKRMTSGSEELDKLRVETSNFGNWLEKAFKVKKI